MLCTAVHNGCSSAFYLEPVLKRLWTSMLLIVTCIQSTVHGGHVTLGNQSSVS